MTFNKHFPHPAMPARKTISPEARAWFLRAAWYASTAMLVVGYILIFALWDR